MPTYRTTARNQLRTPSGAVGEAPDGPGGMATLADDIDNIFGVGGAEYCANAAALAAIPSSRKFIGKLAYRADNGVVYRWQGIGGLNLQGNDTSRGWQAWEQPGQSFNPTYSGATLGTGATNAGFAGISAGTFWVNTWLVLGTGPVITAGGDLTLTNLPGNGGTAEWAFGSGVYRPAGGSADNVMIPLVPYMVNTTYDTATGSVRIRAAVTGTAGQPSRLRYLLTALAAAGVTPAAGDIITLQLQSPASGAA